MNHFPIGKSRLEQINEEVKGQCGEDLTVIIMKYIGDEKRVETKYHRKDISVKNLVETYFPAFAKREEITLEVPYAILEWMLMNDPECSSINYMDINEAIEEYRATNEAPWKWGEIATIAIDDVKYIMCFQMKTEKLRNGRKVYVFRYGDKEPHRIYDQGKANHHSNPTHYLYRWDEDIEFSRIMYLICESILTK